MFWPQTFEIYSVIAWFTIKTYVVRHPFFFYIVFE